MSGSSPHLSNVHPAAAFAALSTLELPQTQSPPLKDKSHPLTIRLSSCSSLFLGFLGCYFRALVLSTAHYKVLPRHSVLELPLMPNPLLSLIHRLVALPSEK